MVPSHPRRRRRSGLFALVAALVLTSCTPSGTLRHTAAPDQVQVGDLRGRTGAYLLVKDAASRVEIRLADLPGLLYRISTPPGAGLAPRVTRAGARVRVGLKPTGADGPDQVTILLNRGVRWDIRLPAGAGEQRLYLSPGSIARVDVGTGGLVDMELPRPSGTIPVIMRGGQGSVSMAVEPGVPVRLNLREGAGSVRTSWFASGGSPAGTTSAAPGWTAAPDRYTVYATAGLGDLAIS
jgi:hypothetical protein